MRRTLAVLITLGWLAPAAADEAARAAVTKAIQAAGGAATLTKFKAYVATARGTFSQPEKTAFTAVMSVQGRDQTRFVVEMKTGTDTVKAVHVLNRDKGWEKVDDVVEELDKERLASAQEDAYLGWVTSLAPLQDKALTLASVGERKVNDRPALGVRVSSKGRRDVTLYFDKETFLLALSESRTRDEDTGKDVTETNYYSDYKDVQGVKTAMKQVTLRDGKPYVDMTLTDIKYHEKLDDKLFGKP